jgi:copper chaperone CopZ
METATYTVVGMTCDHCVRAVRQEVSAIPGVRLAEVDLASGRLDVQSEHPIERPLVVAAVDEAGYEVAP